MNIRRSFFLILTMLLAGAAVSRAQSGGAYELTQTVLGSGAASSGGAFSLENTAAQPVAGPLQNGNFALYAGFWTPNAFAPTAATVTISGRVADGGAGIRNVIVTLTDAAGTVRTTKTGAFGSYRFDDVRAGEIYVLTITSRRFVFSEPTRVLQVDADLAGIDFIVSN
ncbi:MAG: carboxypeptidase regulatory-like domain-containing protein [Acidobacteria bacterium]|nr:carboxypeptidase regulatory-like domain-containing protein [Acidobacteriota bacterium]